MQVMTKLKAESGVKKVVVGALLAASQTYVLAARTVNGMSLTHAQAPPTAVQLVWAQLVAALLRPLHQLAGKLVFSKVGNQAAAAHRPPGTIHVQWCTIIAWPFPGGSSFLQRSWSRLRGALSVVTT